MMPNRILSRLASLLSNGKYWPKLALFLCLAIAFSMLFSSYNGFRQMKVEVDRVSQDIAVLSGPEFEGRQTGSDGNRKCIQYIQTKLHSMGIEPGYSDGTYEQKFKTIVPQIGDGATFKIGNKTAFSLYDDYNILTYYNGGGIDFKGEIILVDSDLMRIPPEEISGRLVIVDAARILPDWALYVQSHGGKGLLCSADSVIFGEANRYERQKLLSIRGKTSQSQFLGYLSNSAYKTLKRLVIPRDGLKLIPDVTLKVDVQFPVVETANVLGIIKGNPKSDHVLVLSANLDGLGWIPTSSGNRVSKNKTHPPFPGASKEASSIASLLEIGRILSQQDASPYRHIVLAFWNGQHQDNSGSGHYIADPIFPLEKSTIIHLEGLGKQKSQGLQIQAERGASSLIAEKIYNYSLDTSYAGQFDKNQGQTLELSRLRNAIALGFADFDIPALVITDMISAYSPELTVDDTPANLDLSILDNTIQLIATFIGREYFPNALLDYLTAFQQLVVILLIGLMIFSPFFRLWSARLLPYIFVVALLAFLVNIRQSTDVKFLAGDRITNFSLYLSVKHTLLYLTHAFSPPYFDDPSLAENFKIIKDASIMSIHLIFTTLSSAFILGLSFGLYESYKAKPFNMRSFGSLVLFSVPDVFIVLLGSLAYVYAYKRYPQIADISWLHGFVVPVVLLSIIPTIYISRITAIAAHEELEKDYITAAKALGYSRFKIFISELFPAIIYKVIDSLPTLMTLLFSNMIIVEYLFNYNGMGYYLLFLYKRQDSARFVPMAIVLGLIYLLFAKGLQSLSRHINPSKKVGLR